MSKKSVRMTLSSKGYKNFNSVMKKMNFKNKNLFLRYCVLKTVKSKLPKNQQKAANKELKMLKEAQK